MSDVVHSLQALAYHIKHTDRADAVDMATAEETVLEAVEEIKGLRGQLAAAESNLRAVERAVRSHVYVHSIEVPPREEVES